MDDLPAIHDQSSILPFIGIELLPHGRLTAKRRGMFLQERRQGLLEEQNVFPGGSPVDSQVPSPISCARGSGITAHLSVDAGALHPASMEKITPQPGAGFCDRS